jgi:hypothetical protein
MTKDIKQIYWSPISIAISEDNKELRIKQDTDIIYLELGALTNLIHELQIMANQL